MAVLRNAHVEAAGAYSSPGDWFRAIQWLEVAGKRGAADESCARVANFLDNWEAANGGPPFVQDGSHRMSPWPTYTGPRGLFVRPGVRGEQLLPDCVPPGFYDPIDYREL